MNNEATPIKYFTSDFGCTIALVAIGYSIVSIDRSNQNRVRFGFNSTASIKESVKSYREFGLNVDARRLYESSKVVKGILYGEGL